MRPVRSLVLAAGLISLMLAGSVFAQQAGQPLKIGVLSDLSSVYSDIGGTGNVEATKMAIEEFGGSMFGPLSNLSPPILKTSRIRPLLSSASGTRTRASI